MYPTVTDMLRDLLGWDFLLPIQTFGFFVAVAFLLAAWALGLELKRKESNGLLRICTERILKGAPATTAELITSAAAGFLVGYKLVYAALNYTEFATNPQDFILSAEGSITGGLAVAALAAWMRKREKDRDKLDKPQWVNVDVRPHEQVGTITLLAAGAGLLGAKIFHILEDPSDFLDDPIGSLLSFSGLTFYGGLIAGAWAVLHYARRKGMALLPLLDAAAPALMLAYGVGRIGCQMAGDGDWGIVNPHPQPAWLSFLPEWTWAYDYPHNVNSVGIPIPGCDEPLHCSVLPHPVYPTPLYEAVMGIGLFGLLWSLRKHIQAPGALFSLYLVANGLERFFIEKIRDNSVYQLAGMEVTQAEIISAALVAVGVVGVWRFWKKKD